MADSIAQIIPTISGDTTLPQLDYATLAAAGYVVPEFETDAIEDYLFDTASSDVLRSRLDGYVLTQGELATQIPVFSAGYLTVDGAYGGLKCRAQDAATISFAIVYRRPSVALDAAALHIIGSDTGGSVSNSGVGIYTTDAGGYNLSIRPDVGDPTIRSAVADAIVGPGEWGFLCAALGPSSAAIYLGAGASLVKGFNNSLVRTGIAADITIGKVLDMGVNYAANDMDVHRALVYDRELSEAEVLALYKRVKIVAARRGVTVQ